MISDDRRPAILVVDDEPHNLTALVALLAVLGTRVVTAASGEQALKRLLEQDFALIMLDVQMPGMNGFETAELIRMRERSRATPILFQTAWASDEAKILRGYAVGAVDYVVKPVDPLVLRSKVSVFLELHRKTSELEQKNLELALARDQAERASAAKSRFLASVSHELRTPLGGILGYGELIAQELAGPLNEAQKSHLQALMDSAEHLSALVNDLLDLAKIEAGKLDLAPSWTQIAALADNVVGTLGPVAAKAGVTIEVDIPADFPRLYLDPLRMRQVFFNLLSNAIKFSPPGSTATLRAYTEPGIAAIAVEDQGIGVPLDQVGRLFHEFERLEPGPDRPSGTGLGLAVARRLVELHRGTIEVGSVGAAGSQPGQGAMFTVRLPTRSASVSGAHPSLRTLSKST